MLLALSGVTGIGKSYFKEKIVEKLNFHKVSTIRTRPIRVGEKNGVDGIFITDIETNKTRLLISIFSLEVICSKRASTSLCIAPIIPIIF